MFKFIVLIGELEDVSLFGFEFFGETFDGFLMFMVEFVGVLVVLGEYFL